MQENPEDFLGDVIEFLIPDPVGSRMPNRGDEFWRFAILGGVGVTKVGEDYASAGCEIERSGTCKVGRD